MDPPAPQKLSTKTDPPGKMRHLEETSSGFGELPSSGFGDALFGSATGVTPGAPCPLPTSPEIDAAGLTN